jgi:hypothetical protein
MRCLLHAGAITILLVFSGTYAITGKAAVIIHTGQGDRLFIVRVSDNAVTTDTILKGNGLTFPAISFDGTRVAFYKSGTGIQVYDIDGKTPARTVATFTQWFGHVDEKQLEWPGADGGKWIYYHLPESRCHWGGSGIIRRVNVDDTSQNFFMCNYKGDSCQIAVAENSLFRWSLSADAKYANQGGVPHLFPPLLNPNIPGKYNPMLTAPKLCCEWAYECNQGLTASGIFQFNFSGLHTVLYGGTWDHAAMTTARRDPYFKLFSGQGSNAVETWLKAGPSPGPQNFRQFHYPHGSCNSDKIITVLLTTENLSDGCAASASVVNWKDQQAVCVANNPNLPGTPPVQVDRVDFFVTGGPAGCYENENGQWISIAGASEIRDNGHPGLTSRSGISITNKGSAIYTLTGKRIRGLKVEDLSSPVRDVRSGAYVCVAGGDEKRVIAAGR